MLIDVAFSCVNPGMHAILTMIGDGSVTPQRLQTGIYRTGHWSFEQLITWPHVEEYPEWPHNVDDTWLNAYGVCDSPEQLLDVFSKQLADPLRFFVVSVTKLRRENEPSEGGWRWRKWGPYIGTQDPQMEYLFDEPAIEEIWTYHVYELIHIKELP